MQETLHLHDVRAGGPAFRALFLVCSLAAAVASAQPPRSLAIVNGASGGTVVAPNSIAAAFGRQIGASTAQATSLPLPTILGGVSVSVTDSTNASQLAPLFYVSPNQINFVVPEGEKNGAATVKVMNGSNNSSATAQIATVAPGLFTANGAGVGVAAAIAIRRILATQTDDDEPAFHCDANGCSSLEIDMDSNSQVFLELFGTGIRGRSSLTNVTATISGQTVTVLFAGPQGQFPGLDQVNLSLPQNLNVHGETDVVLMVDGHAANTVRINLRRRDD